MGTRLYPKSRKENIVEILAGVPVGTHKNLTSILLENRRKVEDAQKSGVDYGTIQEMEYQQWQNLHKTPEGILDGFLTFGWGKFTREAYELLKAHIPANESEDWLWNGETTNTALIDSIMEAMGVDLERLGILPENLEGLCWG